MLVTHSLTHSLTHDHSLTYSLSSPTHPFARSLTPPTPFARLLTHSLAGLYERQWVKEAQKKDTGGLEGLQWDSAKLMKVS